MTPQEAPLDEGNAATLNGRAVILTGELRFEEGVLKGIGTPGGNVQTDISQILRVLSGLQKSGVDVSNVVMKRVEKVPVHTGELIRSEERPQPPVFSLMEKIATAPSAARAADWFREAATLNPGVLAQMEYIPGQLMDLVAADLRIFNAGIAAMGTLDAMALGLLGLRITKACDMMETATTIYGDRIDPEMLAELRRLKQALYKKPEHNGEGGPNYVGTLLAARAAAASIAAMSSHDSEGASPQGAPPQENKDFSKMAATALAETNPLKMVSALDNLSAEAKDLFVPAVTDAAKAQGKSMNALAVPLLELANTFMASEQHWASYRALLVINILFPSAVSADSLMMAKKKAGAGRTAQPLATVLAIRSILLTGKLTLTLTFPSPRQAASKDPRRGRNRHVLSPLGWGRVRVGVNCSTATQASPHRHTLPSTLCTPSQS